MEVDTKIGSISECGINLLVDRFYAKVRVDPFLALSSNGSCEASGGRIWRPCATFGRR